MFIAEVFATGRKWQKRKCLSRDEWIMETWYMYTTEYYSAVSKTEVSGEWINLETMICSEEPQRQKNKCHILSLIFASSLQFHRCVQHGMTTETRKV